MMNPIDAGGVGPWANTQPSETPEPVSDIPAAFLQPEPFGTIAEDDARSRQAPEKTPSLPEVETPMLF